MSTPNWSAAGNVIRDEIATALEGILVGGVASMVEYAEALALASVRAAEAGDTLSQESLLRQTRLLAHQHELRTKAVGFEVVEKIVLATVRAGIGAVLAALPFPMNPTP